MSTLSYMHPLFNLDQCHASIPTLRWQERSLPCPRCQSQDVAPWGTSHYRPGGNRSWCPGGQRPCNDLTAPLLHRRQRSLPHGMLATFLLCLSCSARRMSRELGVHGRTKITYHPQSGWFEDTPLKGGTEEGCPLKGGHEGTFLIEAGQPA